MSENGSSRGQPSNKDSGEIEKYKVIHPDHLYRGKGYGDWISDWFNWFLSADADKRNSGPVAFLRSLGLPNKNTGANISDVPPQVTGSDTLPTSLSADLNYSKKYVNDPNIRIGEDRLQIFADQAVLVPIIIAYELASVPSRDWGRMQDFTGLTIDYGDNPPTNNQLTIDNEYVNLRTDDPPEELEMKDFRFITPIFMAVVPEIEYGRSVKDFLEIEVAPGHYPAIVEGYFVMLKFNTPGTYWVHSWASGPREVSGPYFSELLYEIEVREERRPHGTVTGGRPSRNEQVLKRVYKDLIEEQKQEREQEEQKQVGGLRDSEVNKRITSFKNYLRPLDITSDLS
jgi:hypothetical protein